VDEIFSITKIDRWFLWKLRGIADFETALEKEGLAAGLYEEGKRLGYPDETLLRLSGAASLPGEAGTAVYKMVDTCGAEFDAETPYFYSSFDRFCESRAFPRSGRPVIMVLGSGPIRIGQGIEFDYSSVHCVWTLKELGYDVVIVNNNPETVSTDYDTADRLYFEPLYPEDVMHIIEVEKPVGVVVAFGGQTAIKLTRFLDGRGIPILGTSAESIDMAEDRERFDELLERFHIKRPQGRGVLGMEEALAAANELGYPVLLRPSYVIGGQNMVIGHDRHDVEKYMNINLSGGIGVPYRPEEEAVDIARIGQEVRRRYEEILVPAGMGDVAIFTELGRFMLAPFGHLVTTAVHEKHIYKEYIGVDACAANLMRPAIYGAYHHITVVGSLCENSDKFAIDRALPEIAVGDVLVIHDTGAHGFSMGYNYNGKLRSAELLLREDSSVELMRRAETPEDYFATLVW